MRNFALIPVILLLLMACGENETPAEDTEITETDQIIEETTEEDPETAEEVVLYPEGTLDPSTVTPDQVISAGDLNASFFAWEEKEVTIAGYPSIWYGDSMVVDDELGLEIDPDGNDNLVVANFDENSGEVVYRGEIVAIRGFIEENWSGPELNSAVFVTAPENMEPVETSCWVYDNEPIPADQFTDMFNVWNGIEVTVEGYYSSTTTSTLSDGVVVRVDLGSNDDHYNKVAACELAGEMTVEVAEAMAANRDRVQIRGTISGESYNAVGLENCEIVNR